MISTRHVIFISVGFLAGCSSNPVNLVPGAPPPAAGSFVFTETNATSGNAVLAYSRAASGQLTSSGVVSTGGTGVGLPSSGLPFPIGGATGAVAISPNGLTLYAVDAGSDDVAAYSLSSNGTLTLLGRYPTNGTSPASITIDPQDRYLYVLNSGSLPSGKNAPGNISGFTIASSGVLSTLPGSTQPLSSSSAYVDPSEVRFSRDGSYLVATEKATALIDIFPVNAGLAGSPVSRPSTGKIPFGFEFTPSGTLVVTNAESASDPAAATVSSYASSAAGTLNVISGQVPDDQGAACWVAVTSNGGYAYVTNTGSGSISGYAIANGTLKLLTPGGMTAAQPSTTGPIDDAITPDDHYLYVLDSMAGKAPGTIAGFAIAANGSLTSVPTGVSGLQPGSIGLAVR